ncbi:MAG: hypothetical protein GY941_13095 [Planctomycetes bacterium]|nr:hypothetical protein [Planctomycetota bacterium]
MKKKNKKKKVFKEPKHKIRKSKRTSLEQLEVQAREDLAEKRFKRARYCFLELYKLNQDKYFPELLESNLGVARDLIKNEKLDEATAVIDIIKDLTGDESDGALDVLVAIKKKDYDVACRIFTGLIARGNCIPELKSIPEVADAFILAFEDFSQLIIPCTEIYENIISVQLALENVSAERFEEAWDMVKKISVNSIFSNWKMFIKGITAFYAKDDKKALSAFRRISPDSLLQSTVSGYVILLEYSTLDKGYFKENYLQKACIIAGYPELASILPRSNYLWKVGRYSDSYRHLRSGLKAFPSGKGGIVGTLTSFYYNSIYHLPEKQAKKYLDRLKGSFIKPSSAPDIEEVLIRRAECLFYEFMLPEDLKYARLWEEFLVAYTGFYGRNNKLEALAYSLVGAMFSQVELTEPSFLPWQTTKSNSHNLRNAQLAEQYFNKSIASDKENKDACLGLLNVYEKTGKKSKANKLLDKLAPAFPDDQTIMTRAGRGCIDRKAFVKGIKYLERARMLDPLDRTIKSHLAHAYLCSARNYYKKKQFEKGRETYRKALDNGSAGSIDFNLGHAYIYARWAASEYKCDNESTGEEKLKLSVDGAANHLPVLYFAQLCFQESEVPDVYLKNLKELIDKEWKKPPAPATAVVLLKTYACAALSSQSWWLYREKERVVKYAIKAASKPCSREDALAMVQFDIIEEGETRLGETYIKKMLKEDRDDPGFLYLRHRLKIMQGSHFPGNSGLNELNRILRIAEKRNDMELTRKLGKEIEEFESMLKMHDILSLQPPPEILDMLDDDELDMYGTLFDDMMHSLDDDSKDRGD